MSMKNFFCLIFLLVVGARVQAATVTFAGSVVNGSVGDSLAPNATVQFLRVNEKGASEDLATVKTSAQGRFKTKPLAVHAADLVFARVDWGGYPYITPAYDGAGRTGGSIDSSNLRLRIYDTAEVAPNGLSFVAHHIALKDDGDNLKCIERIVVENPSNKTVIGLGKEGITLGLSLPKGAKNVEIDPSIADAKLVTIGKDKITKAPIYGVSKPITPSSNGGPMGNAVIVNYTLPWSRSVDLSRKLMYPEKFFFIVREVGDKDKILVDAPLLGADETQPVPIDGQMQNRVVKMIGAPQSETPVLQAGQIMEIHVSRPVSTMMWGFIGLTLALCIFLPTLMLWSRKKPTPIEYSNRGAERDLHAAKSAEPRGEASVYSVIHSQGEAQSSQKSGQNANAHVASLIEKLAVLDDDWDAGRIEEPSYQAQRAQLKQQVVEQMKKTAETVG